MRYSFRYPPLSAIAPMMGERNATKSAVMVIPLDHKTVPTISFSAMTLVKNVP